MSDTLVKGRQILLMVFEWYRVVEADGAVFDFTHLNAVKMHDQDLAKFMDQLWYTVEGASGISISTRGTRAGCSLGDLFFP